MCHCIPASLIVSASGDIYIPQTMQLMTGNILPRKSSFRGKKIWTFHRLLFIKYRAAHWNSDPDIQKTSVLISTLCECVYVDYTSHIQLSIYWDNGVIVCKTLKQLCRLIGVSYIHHSDDDGPVLCRGS